MMCMACIHTCPMMAIQMRMPEKNPKARYRNENISVCEIVEANNQWGENIPRITIKPGRLPGNQIIKQEERLWNF